MKKRYIYLITFVVISLTFGVGFFSGQVYKINDYVTNDSGDVEISKVLDLYSKTRSDKVEFDRFWELWDKVKVKYVDQPISDTDLFYGAMSGLVSGLNDPYSIYFPPKKAEEFAEGLSGEFEGIGAEIGLRENQLTIIAPLKGSPAEKSGLMAGDKVLAINDEDAYGFSLDEAVSKIRGEKGTQVVLTISRNGFDDLQDISVIRDTINVPTVEWEMKENNIAYLRISYFNQDTWEQFDQSISEMLLKSPQGLIVDLRSNPGGYLNTAVAIASEWVEKGLIVKEKFSGEEEKHYETSGEHRLAGIKTIILVDEGTASGSEILAGALQDHGLATVLGKKTYGKGSVQEFEVFPDGSALKITVAKWYTPKDRQITKQGIEPDIYMEEMFVDIEFNEISGQANYRDLGIEKALELLVE